MEQTEFVLKSSSQLPSEQSSKVAGTVCWDQQATTEAEEQPQAAVSSDDVPDMIPSSCTVADTPGREQTVPSDRRPAEPSASASAGGRTTGGSEIPASTDRNAGPSTSSGEETLEEHTLSKPKLEALDTAAESSSANASKDTFPGMKRQGSGEEGWAATNDPTSGSGEDETDDVPVEQPVAEDEEDGAGESGKFGEEDGDNSQSLEDPEFAFYAAMKEGSASGSASGGASQNTIAVSFVRSYH